VHTHQSGDVGKWRVAVGVVGGGGAGCVSPAPAGPVVVEGGPGTRPFPFPQVGVIVVISPPCRPRGAPADRAAPFSVLGAPIPGRWSWRPPPTTALPFQTVSVLLYFYIYIYIYIYMYNICIIIPHPYMYMYMYIRIRMRIRVFYYGIIINILYIHIIRVDDTNTIYDDHDHGDMR